MGVRRRLVRLVRSPYCQRRGTPRLRWGSRDWSYRLSAPPSIVTILVTTAAIVDIRNKELVLGAPTQRLYSSLSVQ